MEGEEVLSFREVWGGERISVVPGRIACQTELGEVVRGKKNRSLGGP